MVQWAGLQLSDVFEGKPEVEEIIILKVACDSKQKEFLKRQTLCNYKNDGKPQKQLLQAPSAEAPMTGQLSKITLQYVIYSFTIHSCVINQYMKVVSSF